MQTGKKDSSAQHVRVRLRGIRPFAIPLARDGHGETVGREPEKRKQNMPVYQVTAVTFGLGFQLGSTRTKGLNEHLQSVAAQGWRLVAVDHNNFEIPLVWRFFWERSDEPENS